MSRSGPPATHGNVHELATALGLDEAGARRAFELAALSPDATEWRRYVDRFLLAIGSALVIAGIAAFIAWNWADLHRMAKFALIEVAIVGAVVLAWRLGLDALAGRASLFAAAFLTGVLLALYGQVYQTGADPYGLFLAWGMLVLPWAIVGRQAALWLLVLVLANLALLLYWIQVLHPPEGWWQLGMLMGPLTWLTAMVTDWRIASLLFALNAGAVVAWEVAAARGVPWAQGHLLPRAAGLIALYTVCVPTLLLIFAGASNTFLGVSVASPVLLALAVAACLTWYQYGRRDLLMLTEALCAGIATVTALAIRYSPDAFEVLFPLSLLLIGQVAGAALWLRRISARWEANP